jgi:hypothetical protein
LVTLDSRERAVLAAIRAGAKGLGGIKDRLNWSHGTSAINKCLEVLIGANLINSADPEKPLDGPWTLTELAKSVDHKPVRDDRGRNAVTTAAVHTTTVPKTAPCPRGRTVHCPHCQRIDSDPRLIVVGRGEARDFVPATYSDAERLIKTPIPIIPRTSDTTMF